MTPDEETTIVLNAIGMLAARPVTAFEGSGSGAHPARILALRHIRAIAADAATDEPRFRVTGHTEALLAEFRARLERQAGAIDQLMAELGEQRRTAEGAPPPDSVPVTESC
jgi:hypothetical protein